MNFGRVAAALFLVVLALACSARAGGEAEVHADDDRRAADAADDRSVPAGDPCDFDVLDDASSVPAGQGPLAVGKFVVRLEGGSVFVEHESEPGRVLFATPGGVLVGAAAVSLEVTEGQGSFQVKEVVKHRCGGAADEVRWDGLRLRLDGVLGGACSGQRFTWRFCNPLPNHLRFEIELGEGGADAVFLQARADDDERFYGMGEQFARDTLDLRGRVVPVVVQEGGVGRGEEKASQFMETVSPGSSGSEAATYYPVPHYVSSLDRSLFLEGESISVFDFGQGGVVEVRGYARRMAGRILFGGSPLELVERFTASAG
ncbi:MAG: hypothetical protein FJ109_14010, partial [Deltaproteobacteria bacterium]|nr:hypothetical protein [Deltaproteobacteria bacterium]